MSAGRREIRPEHELRVARQTARGYVVVCRCGHVTDPAPARVARERFRRHLAKHDTLRGDR
jgi:hypothetical protein